MAHRAGVLKRIWRFVKTARRLRGVRGWRNKLGLPNPGIESWKPNVFDAPERARDPIVSVHGFESPKEWANLSSHVSYHAMLD